jgi:hypothetical protein
MQKISKPLINKFLKKAGDKLKGEWILLGGSLIPVLGKSLRITHDIDLAGFSSKEQTQTLELLEVAEDLGIAIEAINQASVFFLHKIPNWRKDLIILHRGKRSTFYRPNATLYLTLKINRFSESDLEDCLAMLKIASELKEPIDLIRLNKSIQSKRSGGNQHVLERLNKLKNALNKF